MNLVADGKGLRRESRNRGATAQYRGKREGEGGGAGNQVSNRSPCLEKEVR